jgi:solute carrier family 36 (proton-coupled amino acid transporter)
MVKMAISLGVLLGYAIQFFIPIQIMYPYVRENFSFASKYPFVGELLFRALMVLITFAVAQLVPNLSALLSLIGAVCSTILALVFPPLMEMILLDCESLKLKIFIYSKNAVILILSLLGFVTGAYESIIGIVKSFNSE